MVARSFWLMFFFVCNTICCLAGVALVASSIVVLIWHEDDRDLFTNLVALAPIICTMGLGALIVIVTPIGCCSAIRKTPYMIYTYPGMMSFIVLGSLALAITFFVRQEPVEQQAGFNLFNRWFLNLQVNTVFTNDFQQRFECCGFATILEWGNVIPASCCATNVPACTLANAFAQSCSTALNIMIDDAVVMLGTLNFITAGVHALNGFFAGCVARRTDTD